jgi:hypothetical protein
VLLITLPLDTTPPPPPRLPDNLACVPTVFMKQDGHVPPLQLLYDGPYAVLRRSLHHFTLCIGDKEDKVSTLRLKPCTDHTAQPIVRGRLPATICFWDFWEPFSPGQPPGVFAHPADVLDNAAARPARNRRAPTRLDL